MFERERERERERAELMNENEVEREAAAKLAARFSSVFERMSAEENKEVELSELAASPASDKDADDQETGMRDAEMKNTTTATAMKINTDDASDGSEESEDILARRTMRKVSWRVLPLIGFAVSISQVEKVNISLAAEGIMRDLSLDAQQFGLATSLYFIPYATLEVPCALLAKRLGPRRGLGLLALVFGGVSMCTAASNNLATLLILRFLLGTVESGVFPFTDYITSIFFSHDTLGRALAEKAIWAGLMRIVMGPAGAFFLWIGTTNSWMAEWRWLLFLDGIPALLTGVLVLLLLPSSSEECRSFLRVHEYQWLIKKADETRRERERRSEALANKNRRCGGVLVLLRDIRILVMMVVLLLALTCLFGYIFFSPLILQGDDEEKKRSMITISLLDAVPAYVYADQLLSVMDQRQTGRAAPLRSSWSWCDGRITCARCMLSQRTVCRSLQHLHHLQHRHVAL